MSRERDPWLFNRLKTKGIIRETHWKSAHLKGREADLFSKTKLYAGIVPWPLETILALLNLPVSGGYMYM